MDVNNDRRAKPRVSCHYSAIVEYYDKDGNKYNENAKLANLSASGLYMRANRNIENGSNLAVTILLTNGITDGTVPKLAIHGVVVRSEPQLDGICGIAVKFINHRFQ